MSMFQEEPACVPLEGFRMEMESPVSQPQQPPSGYFNLLRGSRPKIPVFRYSIRY